MTKQEKYELFSLPILDNKNISITAQCGKRDGNFYIVWVTPLEIMAQKTCSLFLIMDSV
jgi:hypothetical protein